MYNDLSVMFYSQLVPAYENYMSLREGDLSGRYQHLRVAAEAATVLYHFREHFPKEHMKKRSQIVAECPEYRLIADFVNAIKHREIRRKTPDGPSLLNSVEDIEETTVVTGYEDEEGYYSDSQTVIFINCSDGVRRSLDFALTAVLNYWGTILKRLSITDFSPRKLPEEPGSRFISRTEARHNNLEISKGLPHTIRYQMLKFDASKGYAEPIDLTDAQISWSVHKPALALHGTLTVPNSGEEIACSLDLTEEQSLEFVLLKSKTERNAFVESILEDRREEIGRKFTESLRAQRSTSDQADLGMDSE